ncbi:hypothetical protein SAMN05421553_0209 [Pseudomonas anguilliseptica]|uniref:Uncharacterized protein n=1 Tax=Pseudomonas anguilliseptica TaxID=53406 RepID=A0A1H4P7P3_PSEAG|nr:hypothetical protein SAMN05421553_0209 [Pseudomonas anguilliseptica]
MFNSPLLRILGATIAASALLSGCSINGSYPDATEPDAAKLRFISDLESARSMCSTPSIAWGAPRGCLITCSWPIPGGEQL